MKNYYGIDFDKKRTELLSSKTAAPMIKEIVARADAALEKTYAALKFSDYMLFAETGDRKTFQLPFSERRNDCSYLSIAYWLSEDEKYKKPLEDLIFHICDEFTWCLPAHSLIWGTPTAEQILREVDLRQAETSRLLTDIYLLLGDKLHYLVKQRIEFEIRRRVFDSFKYKEFHWLKPSCKTNWAAVCAGGILNPLLLFGTKEQIDDILPALYEAIEHFLLGFGDDGCCMEGCSYWSFGFEYFVLFAKHIFEYTGGEVNYFAREKVKAIATFIQRARLTESTTVTFSDCNPGLSFSPGLLSFLKTVYPDDIKLPPLKYGTRIGNIYSMKELLWFISDYKEDALVDGASYFENAEWYISRYPKYSFAAKAGHNNEPHNHNDIGSFLVVTADEKMPLVDLGAGEYTAFTFDENHRYKMIEHASFGHSVPIINGKYQIEGEEYRATNVFATESSFSFDMEGAYESGLVKKLRRTFELSCDGITLCDRVEYSDATESITERFVSTVKPEMGDGSVKIGGVRMLYDKERYTPSLGIDSYVNHQVERVDIYLLDFTSKNERETEFRFEIAI